MKPYLIYSLMLNALLINMALAEDKETNELGTMTNDVQMFIRFNDGSASIKTNELFTMLVGIINRSTNSTLRIDKTRIFSDDFDFICVITSPAGKDLSPVKHEMLRDSSWSVPVPPNQTYKFEVNSGNLAEFDELGTYTIVAKERIKVDGKADFWVVSNPLRLLVVPGEWKDTNAPPVGFKF